jgi:nucleolar GTP-binding protein
MDQCNLFHSIKPLFANKPTLLVINKIDVMRLEQLPAESRALVDQIIKGEDVKVVQASCHTEEGVMDVRNAACDALLAHRVEAKMKGNKVNSIVNRIHVAMPKPRDDIKREPFIPEVVLNRRKYDPNDPERRTLEKDIEAQEGGPGVYSIDMRSMCPAILCDFVIYQLDRGLDTFGSHLERGRYPGNHGW